MRKIFSSARRLGLCNVGDLDCIVDKQTLRMVSKFLDDPTHFIHAFMEQLPSGRYRSFKIRGAWGTGSFYRQLVFILNANFVRDQ